MVEKINVLLISRNENCVTEVTDFLLKSECISRTYLNNGSNDVGTITDYAYRGGPPTEIKGYGRHNSKVHFVLTSFNKIKSDSGHYDAIIMLLNNNAEKKILLDYVQSPNYLNCRKSSHSLTIIGNLDQDMVQSLTKLFETQYCESNRWMWNETIAYNWSTYKLSNSNNLWIHITKNKFWFTRVSYNSEILLRSTISLLHFFKQLLDIIFSNMLCIARGMDSDSIDLLTFTHKGNSYRQQYIKSKNVLMQFNISNLGDFERLLKKEIEQLASHLPKIVILRDGIINIPDDLYYQLFHHFSDLEEFKDLDFNQLQNVNRETITVDVFHSLDAILKMKYTGKYIKNVFGIEKLNALKDYLKRHYSFGNMKNNSTTIVENLLGNGLKEYSLPTDIHVENRIGNIQLLKSLQNTLQEFTEELRDMRQFREQHTKFMTDDNKKIKEKLISLEQENMEIKKMLNDLKNMEEDTKKNNENLCGLCKDTRKAIKKLNSNLEDDNCFIKRKLEICNRMTRRY